jgi:hypothetical protein
MDLFLLVPAATSDLVASTGSVLAFFNSSYLSFLNWLSAKSDGEPSA